LCPDRIGGFRGTPSISAEIRKNGAFLATVLATILGFLTNFKTDFWRSCAMNKNMSKSSSKHEPTGYPEYAVRAEVIGRFFSPPLASSTFHDFVNKGKIVPMKGIRGFYLLNDSLRRLGLREVPNLPGELVTRTAEEIIRLAFSMIDHDRFEAPSWLLTVEAIDAADLHHAESIISLHADALGALAEDRLQHAYLQGVLDAAVMSTQQVAAD
jgi:hypothetical protein